MSLLSDAMESCKLLNKVTVDDGYGGVITRYSEGATINAAIVYDNSIEAQTALSNGVSGIYTVTMRKGDYILQYHDVFKRVSDGKTFRVTTDGDDNKTPGSAGLNMRQVRAEEWKVPNG